METTGPQLSLFQDCYRLTPNKEDPQQRAERVKYAHSLNLDPLVPVESAGKPCMIVGSAPSIVNYVGDIIKRQDNTIFSINGAYGWLLEQGVKPTHHVLFEYELAKLEQSLNAVPLEGVQYLTASHTKESVLDELDGHQRTIWHYQLGDHEHNVQIERLFKGQQIINCPRTTLFATVCLAILLGYREFNFFGVDGSLDREGNYYIPGYKSQLEDSAFDVAARNGETGGFRHFRTTPGLCHQTDMFFQFCQGNKHLKIQMHGDGMLPFLHQTHFQQNYA